MGSPFVGEIRVFGGNFAPSGWAFCNGQIISIAQNNALFALIGTTYGGDGQTTFALPNLQGRSPVHQGTAPSGTAYVEGEVGGSETVTLLGANLPPHTHPINANVTAGTTDTPGSTVAMASAPAGQNLYASNTASQVPLNAQAVGPGPGGQAHDNRQPFLALNYIISLFGIFPSRN